MVTVKEDLELHKILFSLKEEQALINHDKNIQNYEKAKDILSRKINSSSSDGKRYLEKQYKLVDEAHKNALLKQKIDLQQRKAIINSMHEKAVNNTIQKELAKSQKYDENNPIHKSLIKDYHKQKMEQVRSYKLKEEAQSSSVQAALINQQTKALEMAQEKQIKNSANIRHNSVSNLLNARIKSTNNTEFSKVKERMKRYR